MEELEVVWRCAAMKCNKLLESLHRMGNLTITDRFLGLVYNKFQWTLLREYKETEIRRRVPTFLTLVVRKPAMEVSQIAQKSKRNGEIHARCSHESHSYARKRTRLPVRTVSPSAQAYIITIKLLWELTIISATWDYTVQPTIHAKAVLPRRIGDVNSQSNQTEQRVMVTKSRGSVVLSATWVERPNIQAWWLCGTGSHLYGPSRWCMVKPER
jgi:hypothetical protein